MSALVNPIAVAGPAIRTVQSAQRTSFMAIVSEVSFILHRSLSTGEYDGIGSDRRRAWSHRHDGGRAGAGGSRLCAMPPHVRGDPASGAGALLGARHAGRPGRLGGGLRQLPLQLRLAELRFL